MVGAIMEVRAMFQIKLKELRERGGYSQYSFAKAFGVAQSTVGNWEAGKREPNYETTQRLADFFKVSLDYLLGRTEESARILEIPEDFKGVYAAFHRGEFEDLTQDEVDTLAVIARSLKDRRRGPEGLN